ncbi:oxygenase MpaB family protein [Allopontixanthobacter sediminis]|uniref:DUF2236 domain-containing protein n=1 Tax=Allopontixanthobacter sediminis TaxID=1689985 RepID=A0A845B448_9SPHN|nr:oxygenase MpaB family protein [Allopontixanthobacter sediminis]MXP45435.1 DUF2236 domain-containing protein [Allopontixanthobacter sediminis]
MLLPRPSEKIREQLVGRVRALFNDVEGGQKPVPPSDNALFERDSPIRLVHADIISMMVGGVRGLLLQMLHPHALQGVLDHSDFRSDMHGRLRRTARFIAVTTFGEASEAEKTIARVNRIHRRVTGTLPDGTAYSATNPQTLAWVHLAEATSFLEGYLRYVRPAMPYAEQDEYFRQFAVIARKLGADPVPETRAEAERMLREMRPQLHSSPAAKEIARLVLSQRPEGTPIAVQKLLGTAAVDLLPPYARTMLGLQAPGFGALPARAATQSMGSALRWAFRQ